MSFQNDKQQSPMINRTFNVNDFNAPDDRQGYIEGHAAVFGQKSIVAGRFYEVIERGAFDGCDFTDVPFLINHDNKRIPIARSRRNNGNSTMTISVDDTGLKVSANLDIENNLEARSIHSAVKRGDVDGMSFLFAVAPDGSRWENMRSEMPTRVIERIHKVFEVSAVNNPVYAGTDIHARGSLESDRTALENAVRAYELENSKRIEAEKLKLQILLEV